LYQKIFTFSLECAVSYEVLWADIEPVFTLSRREVDGLFPLLPVGALGELRLGEFIEGF